MGTSQDSAGAGNGGAPGTHHSGGRAGTQSAETGGDPANAGGPSGAPGLSCASLQPICGPDFQDDCCAVDAVQGGTFTMGRDSSLNAVVRPQHRVTLSDFKLDRYEVSVGRFRNFVAAYEDMLPPAIDSGAYPGKPQSGWRSEWNSLLPPDEAALENQLACDSGTEIGGAPTLAITCVDWYVAFAFCVWDGGRLPTEAEWEYAAAGGSQQRTYPWGNSWPDPSIANYAYYGSVIAVGSSGEGPFLGLGRGRFGQYDLIGNVWEWVRDDFQPGFYASPAATEPNPLSIGEGAEIQVPRVIRGSSFVDSAPGTATAFDRSWRPGITSDRAIGLRCARN